MKTPDDTESAPKVASARLVCSSRLTLALVGFLGFANLYAQRVDMSVALVCMLNHTALSLDNASDGTQINSTVDIDQTCYAQPAIDANHTYDGGQKASGSYLWSTQEQGIVLGSFFWGYMLTQLPGGLLAEKFGGKRVMLYCMLAGAIFTLLAPLAARVHIGLFIATRIGIGLAGGVVFPACHSLWSSWAPPLERSILVGLTYSGAQIGNVVALPLSGFLCAYVGWESIFYVIGASGVLWCVLWAFYAADSPEQHKHISASEVQYIEHSLKGHLQPSNQERDGMPWKSIVCSAPVWAIVVAHTAGNFGSYLMLTTLPTYMKQVLHFDIKSNGLVSAIPYVAYFCVIQLATNTADLLRRNNILRTGNVRKLMMIIAMFGQSAFLVLAGHCSCGQELLAVLCITVAQGFSGAQYAGFVPNHADIAPKYAGSLFGISNTVATVSGIAAPYIATALTPEGTLLQWRSVFWVASAILCFGAIFFAVFASGDLQPWAKPKEKQSELERSILLENNTK